MAEDNAWAPSESRCSKGLMGHDTMTGGVRKLVSIFILFYLGDISVRGFSIPSRTH